MRAANCRLPLANVMLILVCLTEESHCMHRDVTVRCVRETLAAELNLAGGQHNILIDVATNRNLI
jgi:hypothetical protein